MNRVAGAVIWLVVAVCGAGLTISSLIRDGDQFVLAAIGALVFVVGLGSALWLADEEFDR